MDDTTAPTAAAADAGAAAAEAVVAAEAGTADAGTTAAGSAAAAASSDTAPTAAAADAAAAEAAVAAASGAAAAEPAVTAASEAAAVGATEAAAAATSDASAAAAEAAPSVVATTESSMETSTAAAVAADADATTAVGTAAAPTPVAAGPPLPPPPSPAVPAAPAVSVVPPAAATPARAVASTAAAMAGASALEAFPGVRDAYDKLHAAVDPETEPYESKYAGRALLEKWLVRARTEAAAGLSGTAAGVAYDVALAGALARLGANYLLTEEPTSGEQPLLEVSQLAQRYLLPVKPPAVAPPRRLAADEVVPMAEAGMEACNYLSLLYSGWDKHARALRYLRLAKVLFACARDAGGSSSSSGGRSTAVVDSLYTHTLFYMAQVYGRLGDMDASCAYVEATLRRQLAEQHRYLDAPTPVVVVPAGGDAAAAAAASHDPDAIRRAALETGAGPDWRPAGASDGDTSASGSDSGLMGEAAGGSAAAPAASLDRLEWVRNAIRLTDYFCIKSNFEAAVQCLTAADLVLAQAVAAAVPPLSSETAALVAGAAGVGVAAWRHLPESLQRLLAEVAVAWGKLFVTVLRLARDREAGMAADDEESATPTTATPTTAAAAAAAAAGKGADEEDDGGGAWEEDGEDPFSTLPGAGFRRAKAADRLRRRKGGLLGRRIVGKGADAIDLDDSDHDGDQTLLVSGPVRGGAAAAAAAATPTAESTAAAPGSGAVKLPFTQFLRRAVPACGPRGVVFYGPASLGTAGPAPGHCVSGLAALPAPRDVTTFAVARDLFKAALTALLRGLDMFVLDGFVTDHVAVQTYVSKAYKYLATWETDPRRIAAMHGRRIEALAPILAELNSAVYIHMHKELALEVATACQEQFEARAEALEARLRSATGGGGGPTPAELDATVTSLDRAIENYAHFLRCYRDARLAGAPISASNAARKPLPGATDLDDGSVEAYLTAHFAIARLLSRRPTADAETQVEDCKRSLFRFAWLAANAAAITPPPPAGQPPIFHQELAMCREMVALLPDKITMLHQRATAAAAMRRTR